MLLTLIVVACAAFVALTGFGGYTVVSHRRERRALPGAAPGPAGPATVPGAPASPPRASPPGAAAEPAAAGPSRPRRRRPTQVRRRGSAGDAGPGTGTGDR